MPGSESTTYTEYFSEKPVNPAQPIRSGTASGSRRNNPHPQKVRTNVQIYTRICLYNLCMKDNYA